jgi:hypothetical protein
MGFALDDFKQELEVCFVVDLRSRAQHGVQPGRQRTLKRTNGLETDAHSADAL